MGNFFVSIFDFFEKRRVALLVLSLLCFAGTAFLASRLSLEEDIAKALPNNAQTARFTEAFQQSKFLEKIVLTVSQIDTTAEPDPERLIEYTETLLARIDSTLRPYIATVQARVDDDIAFQLLDHMNEHLPVFLDEADYRRLDDMSRPEQLRASLEDNLRTLSSPSGVVLKRVIARDPVGITWLGMRKYQDFQYDENYELYDGYVMTKNARHLVLFIIPSNPTTETIQNQKLVDGLSQAIRGLSAEGYADVETTFFGATAVAVGNAVQLRKDTLLTLSLTVVLLLAVTWWFFRRKRIPILMMLPVAFGVLFALAGIYLVQGSISIIAVGTGSVVLGLALNYSIHFFTHRRQTDDVRTVIRELAQPMTLGSATTVGAFLCLQLVNSPILRDLGLFAAFSLIGAALFTLLALPHFDPSPSPSPGGEIDPTPGPSPHGEGSNPFWVLILRSWIFGVRYSTFFKGKTSRNIEYRDPNIQDRSMFHRTDRPAAGPLDRLAARRPERNRYLVAGLLLLTPVMFYFARTVRFDSDMNHLNFMTDSLKTAQDKLNRLNAFALQSVYVVSEGNSLEEALRHTEALAPVLEQLKKDGAVRKYSGVSTFLMSDSLQHARIGRWHAYWTPAKKQAVLETLVREGRALGFRDSAFEGFRTLLDKNFQPVSAAAVEQFKTLFLSDYVNERPGKVSVVTLLKSEQAHWGAVYERLSGQPNTLILDKQFLTRQFVGLVQQDFNNIALYSSLLVFLSLLLAYGRIELAVITFLPMLVSWIWILGLMSLLGLEFNIVNIILSALIFGLGDDFAIFVMEGLQQQYKTGQRMLPVIRTSIFMSAIATLIGLGVLVFARHPAVHSLALVSI
ncbi:MAG: glycerol acyltransferase, partial [Saprospiraceae bacterium]|nr:glycerol acyltransferase [Saprospiraceae bacterium]